MSMKFYRALTLGVGLVMAGNLSINAQNVTFNGEKLSLKKAFEKIESVSKYKIAYNASQIDVTKIVTLNQKNVDVLKVLDQILKGSGCTYKINDGYIVITPINKNNVKKIEGNVKDHSGAPVIGATVMVKGTTTGTITDFDGNFSIDAEEGALLEFSYIGYQSQQLKAKSGSLMSVVLSEDTELLDEVVVVGYGVVKKSDLTGSVSRVSSKDLGNVPVSSIDKALQGRAAGVQISSVSGQPGAGTSIRIRGGNSISANNEPLYVIDGFIGGGDLNSINPSDIESIEILKDAAATSIYGSRGANGVIMITTKKGKEGVNKINLSFYQGFQSLPKKLPFMDGQERAAYANDFADYTNTPRPFQDLSKVTNTDWQDILTRVAPMTNADFSISGGNKDFKHYISGNYYNQEGIYRGSGFSRYQLRVNLDKQLFKWLKIGIQSNSSYTHSDNPKFGYQDYIKEAITYSPVYNEDGSYNYLDAATGAVFDNPVANIDLIQDDTYKKRFLTNAYLEVNPIKNLIFKSTFGVDFSSGKTEQYLPGSLPVRNEQKKGGFAKVNNSNYYSFLNENTLNYLLDINKHSFSFLLGMTLQKETASSSWISVEGFTNDLMGFNNLAAGDPSTSKYGSNYYNINMLSYLSRINYSYDGKYLFTITGRYDGSSRLAENNKWAFFPSFAVAWRLSEEPFIKKLNVFHNLKLRASYGQIGNQAIDVYQSLASLKVVSPTFGGNKDVGYILDNLSNPNLKWETTSQVDVGLEAAFLDGKLSFELDYYYKRTKDLLMDVEIPWTSGYKTQLQNIGKVQNQGIEFMVNSNIINNKDFSLDLNMNISKNKNKVLDINGAEYIDLRNGVRLYKGQPAGVFVGAVYDGTWKSQEEIDANPNFMPGVRPGCAKFKDINGNGKYDGIQDYAILGSAEPKFFGGFGSNFRYKDFSLELFFQGSYGNKILNQLASNMFFGGFASNLYEYEDGQKPWSEENPNSNIPAAGSLGYNVNVNNMNYDVCVQDGSYLKLKTLKFSYNIPVNGLSWINNANVYLLCNNLFTWTSYRWGYDPDVTGSGAVIRGVDEMVYPQNRTIQVGFNVEF